MILLSLRNMKKDIRDFHMEECIIDLPDSLWDHEHVLSSMIYSLNEYDKGYIYMKKHFSNKCIIWYKKTWDIFDKEYYFYKKEYLLSDMLRMLHFEILEKIESYNYYWYTFEFIKDTFLLREVNICDTSKSYILSPEGLIRKNIYFFFRNNEKKKIISCLLDTIHFLTKEDLKFLLHLIVYQRQDGTIVIGKKRQSETLYFTRINYHGFLEFCRMFSWEDHLWEFLKWHTNILEHYVYDISIEYTFKDGKMCISKTAFYSLL